MCWYKNAGVAGYAEAFRPVQSDSQTSEWYSYFENDVLGIDEFTWLPETESEIDTPITKYYNILYGFNSIVLYARLSEIR